MRTGMIVLAALAFSLSGPVVMAQPTGGVDAYRPNPDMLAGRLGGFVLDNRRQEQDMLLARLNEKNFRASNDATEQAAAGGMSTAGAAGGVGN